MKAAVLVKPREIQMRDIPKPVPRRDEVLVRVKSVGICGSDSHLYKTGGTGPVRMSGPLILGHEAAGVIEEAGDEVKNRKIGDRVSIEPGIPCFKCSFCLSGKYNVCPDMRFFATPPVDGAFTEYVKVPEILSFPLAANTSFDEGALLEPFSIGLWACHRSGVSPGSSVLVTGCGPLGITSIMAAAVCGAAKIIAVDVQDFRLEFARRAGATVVLNSSQGDIIPQVLAATNGLGADVAIEATGVIELVQSLHEMVMRGGKIVIAGISAHTDFVPVPLRYLMRKEIDILSLYRYANMYGKALNIVEARKVDLGSLVSQTFPLEKVQEAMEFVEHNPDKAMKVIIRQT
ncbi:MAG: NAD(P)-dependent alcohol dehydrogenase [Spirochaetales bacterium]|jgi:L-iditol 2-dehydrogenase|nr:NAD(P)-dependent alcohol dehydrogenase [Spirochaetales bacterium]